MSTETQVQKRQNNSYKQYGKILLAVGFDHSALIMRAWGAFSDLLETRSPEEVINLAAGGDHRTYTYYLSRKPALIIVEGYVWILDSQSSLEDHRNPKLVDKMVRNIAAEELDQLLGYGRKQEE